MWPISLFRDFGKSASPPRINKYNEQLVLRNAESYNRHFLFKVDNLMHNLSRIKFTTQPS